MKKFLALPAALSLTAPESAPAQPKACDPCSICRQSRKRLLAAVLVIFLLSALTGCGQGGEGNAPLPSETPQAGELPFDALETHPSEAELAPRTYSWDPDWQYAEFSKIHTDQVTWYPATGPDTRNFTIAINAGHGCKNGNEQKTLSHPDGSPKVTGGTNAKGAVESTAISEGTTLLDGTPEHQVTLALALELKELLLSEGFSVLMLREEEDAQLDNIARTVFANNLADCHIALHYNSTDMDAGLFAITVPKDRTYRAMEPVSSMWKQHQVFAEALVQGAREQQIPISNDGFMALDLTQTSYSTIPSVDLEVGDRKSDHSIQSLQHLAKGILAGLNLYYQ